MADIFISYARSTAKQAQQVVKALRQLGYSVWIDDDLPAHRAYTPVIEEQMTAAKAAVVIWSADAVQSEWVLSEANRAREDRKLVQVTTDNIRLPMPFDTIQCADLAGWTGAEDAPGWRKVVASVTELIGETALASKRAEAPPPALPTKPSIAVMPFANLSGDPEQDYFADGMVEEIVTALSRFKSIFVIGSGSTLSFKGKAVSAHDAARQLGVRYVLEGSVRKGGTRVRITAKLIDADGGAQIWTERFEDTLEDIFALQDRVALSVAGVIEPTLRAAEMSRATARPTGNPGSYDLYLRALSRQRNFDKAGVLSALDLLNRAIELDPDYATALIQAGFLHFITTISQWTDDPDFHRRSAIEAVHRALKLTSDDANLLAFAAFIISRLEHDQAAAIALLERALDLNPGSSFVWGFNGIVRVGNGEDAVAIEHIEKALRLDPIGPERGAWMGFMGIAQFQQRRFKEAVTNLREWVRHTDIFIAHGFLAASYGQLGQIDAAKDALLHYRSTTPLPVAELTQSFPDLTLERLFREGIALAEGKSPSDIGGSVTPP